MSSGPGDLSAILGVSLLHVVATPQSYQSG